MEEREYYQIIAKSTEKVNRAWKVLHVLSLLTAAVSGLVAEIYFCRILRGFSNNCVLNANIYFEISQDNNNNNNYTDHAARTKGTKWSSDNMCQFCSAMWIISFLVGVLLCVFFLACAKGGKGYLNDPFYRPWKLICPAFFISLVMLINVMVATGLTYVGLKKFCAEFEPELNTKKCTNDIDMFTVDFPNKKPKTATSIDVVNKCALITLFAWIMFTVVTVIRICIAPDFSLLVITVKTVNYKNTRENTSV